MRRVVRERDAARLVDSDGRGLVRRLRLALVPHDGGVGAHDATCLDGDTTRRRHEHYTKHDNPFHGFLVVN